MRKVLLGVGGAVALAVVGVGLVAGAGDGMLGMDHSATTVAGSAGATAEGMASEDMGGHDMSPVSTTGVESAEPGAEGGRPLPGTRRRGEKVFKLAAAPVRWTIGDGATVGALAYNGQIPGPAIRARVGDRLRIEVTNDLDEPTSVHWHGLAVPNAMDGAGGVTQPNIASGETFTYRFRVTQPGTFFYHSHTAADRQVALGLSGVLIVEGDPDPSVAADIPMMLQEWRITADGNVPAMDYDGSLPNWFTLNGKAYPDTRVITVKRGQRVRIRFIGAGQFAHPMHIHGGPFRIVATDGNPVPRAAQLTKDTVLVAPGERYDVIWTAQRAGTWLVHCHILHHTTNDGREVKGGGGLTTAIRVV